MHFIFDGIKSSDMDLKIMRIGGDDFVQTPLWGGVNIQESVSKKRLVPYFYGVTRDNLEFPPLQLVLCDKNMQPKIWTSNDRYKISKWLCHDTYKEFISSDDLGKRYKVIAEAQTDLHLINTQGYMEVQFRCNSPYAFSPVYINTENLSDNIASKTIILENMSNVQRVYNPLIEIELVNGETDVILTNLSNGGKAMKFIGLSPNETISIDCQNRIIKSNLFGSNPFAKFNVGGKRFWMDLVYGQNLIRVEGMCIVKTKMEYPIAQ